MIWTHHPGNCCDRFRTPYPSFEQVGARCLGGQEEVEEDDEVCKLVADHVRRTRLGELYDLGVRKRTIARGRRHRGRGACLDLGLGGSTVDDQRRLFGRPFWRHGGQFERPISDPGFSAPLIAHSSKPKAL